MYIIKNFNQKVAFSEKNISPKQFAVVVTHKSHINRPNIVNGPSGHAFHVGIDFSAKHEIHAASYSKMLRQFT